MIIAMINEKGGVGKTTTAVTVAHGLALRGKRTLLVDLDSQGAVSRCLGLPYSTATYDLLCRDAGIDAITDSERENLDVVLGGKPTLRATVELVNRPLAVLTLDECLHAVQEEMAYDHIVLDCGPGMSLLQQMALIAAERYLVPVLLHPLSINSVREVLTTVKSMQNRKVEVAEFAGVVPTMYDRVRVVSRELLAYISDAFPNGLTWPAIPTDTRAVEAPNYGQTLWEYAPTCRAIMGIQQDNGETFGGYAKLVEDLLALAESEENNG